MPVVIGFKQFISQRARSDELVSRKPLAAGRRKQTAASALRLTGHRNQHAWQRHLFHQRSSRLFMRSSGGNFTFGKPFGRKRMIRVGR